MNALRTLRTLVCSGIDGEQPMQRLKLLTCCLASVLTAGTANSETCLSPYIKGLRTPEKVMYAWTLPVGQGSDYLSVIDVNLASPTYGKILRKIEVGSVGNEAHHMGFADDRSTIWAAALNTSRLKRPPTCPPAVCRAICASRQRIAIYTSPALAWVRCRHGTSPTRTRSACTTRSREWCKPT